MSHEERNYLAQFLHVKDAMTDETLGYLGDISEHGVMFITSEEVMIDDIKDIIIENNIVDGDEFAVSIKAKIKTIWKKPNINPEMTCIGCTLLEIDPKEREILENLVSKIKFGNEIEIHRTVSNS